MLIKIWIFTKYKNNNKITINLLYLLSYLLNKTKFLKTVNIFKDFINCKNTKNLVTIYF